MQKMKWVRFGLAGVIVGGALGGMSAAGCSSDDNNTSPPDSGTKADSSVHPGDSGTTGDTGTSGDTGTTTGDGGDASPPVLAKVFLVHGAVDPLAFPIRFCFGLGTPADGGTVTVTGGIPPFPDALTPPFPIPGLFPGFGGSVSSSPKLSQYDLSSLTVSLYAINATHITNDTADGGPDGGAELPCENLIGTDALGKSGAGGGTLTLGSDYFYLGTIPAGTLKHDTTWVAAVTGCAPGEPALQAELCPTGYNASTGDLALTAWQVDSVTVPDGGIGAQFANTSTAWDNSGKAEGSASTVAGFFGLVSASPEGGTTEGGTDGGAGADGGASDAAVEASGPQPEPPVVITQTGNAGTISPATLATVPVPLNTPTAGFFAQWITAGGATLTVPPDVPVGDTISPLLYPLPVIDELTYGSGAPAGGSFVYGKGYVFILIGDPNENGPYIGADGGTATSTTGEFNGKFPHFLAFPTAP